MTTSRVSRRTFLKATAAGGAAVALLADERIRRVYVGH